MYKIIEATENHSLIKLWTKGVSVEEDAIKQIKNIASMPFIHSHVAVMPDVHVGKGATIGTVIATKKAIIPAAVGVDIGCGLMAWRTTLTASDLPDNLYDLRLAIELAVPHGRTNNGGKGDRGAWGDVPSFYNEVYLVKDLKERLDIIVSKHPKLSRASQRALLHLGTLGTGNHFIEICLDESQRVWLMLHSGSRGIGNAIGMYFIERAMEEMEKKGIKLVDNDLSYLTEDSEHFSDYCEALEWGQQYAELNRLLMMGAVIASMRKVIKKSITCDESAIQCHHNYVSKEFHFGEEVLVTRKGAVSAKKGQLGIIPGSMGAKSFIVRGKGNLDSFCSCSHGAGRVMSRGAAKKNFTLDDHVKDTEGVECRKDIDVLDETPKAYKPIEAVMTAQKDLVEVVHTLRQIVCVKG